MGKKKLIGIYLPLELVKKLKVYAAEKGRSVSSVVEQALKDFFKRKKGGM